MSHDVSKLVWLADMRWPNFECHLPTSDGTLGYLVTQLGIKIPSLVNSSNQLFPATHLNV